MVFDRCFQIEHVHVVEAEDGRLLVVMPSRYERGRYHDVAHPITEQLRQHVNREVLLEYHRAMHPSPVKVTGDPLTESPACVKLRP